MHPFISTATESELNFIAGLDYGQNQDQYFMALKDLVFQRNGEFKDGDNWFPYEVIELGANSIRKGHEREFAFCTLLVIHAVTSGYDTRTDLSDKFSSADFSSQSLQKELADMLLTEYANAVR